MIKSPWIALHVSNFIVNKYGVHILEVTLNAIPYHDVQEITIYTIYLIFHKNNVPNKS